MGDGFMAPVGGWEGASVLIALCVVLIRVMDEVHRRTWHGDIWSWAVMMAGLPLVALGWIHFLLWRGIWRF